MELQHNGIKVTIDEKSAKFVATVNGRKIPAPSFDAMKRTIDKTEIFKAFPIIRTLPWAWERIQEDEVVALGRVSRGRSRGRATFKTKKSGERSSVIEDTPANRKAIEALIALKKTHEKSNKAQEEAERKADDAIPRRSADKEAGKS